MKKFLAIILSFLAVTAVWADVTVKSSIRNGNTVEVGERFQVEFEVNPQGDLLETHPDTVNDAYSIVDGSLYRTGEEPEASNNKEITVTYGTDEYPLRIKENPYITSENIVDITPIIARRTVGRVFRPGSLPVLSNPCIEAGDVLRIKDRITDEYYLFPVTNYTYGRTITESIS